MKKKKERKKRSYEFERQQGGIYGRVWREESEGGSDVIIMQKNKGNKGTSHLDWRESSKSPPTPREL